MRRRRGRLRLAGAAVAIAGAALLGCMRLGSAWEAGLGKGDFGDLPLPILIPLSLAVVVSTPLALLGLAALSFSEESIDVDAYAIRVATTAFEKSREVVIPRDRLECWRETRWPLSPWWTWSVRRLAAKAGGRLHPVAAAAGPGEKRVIGLALAAATGKPLLDDRGREVRGPAARVR